MLLSTDGLLKLRMHTLLLGLFFFLFFPVWYRVVDLYQSLLTLCILPHTVRYKKQSKISYVNTNSSKNKKYKQENLKKKRKIQQSKLRTDNNV